MDSGHRHRKVVAGKTIPQRRRTPVEAGDQHVRFWRKSDLTSRELCRRLRSIVHWTHSSESLLAALLGDGLTPARILDPGQVAGVVLAHGNISIAETKEASSALFSLLPCAGPGSARPRVAKLPRGAAHVLVVKVGGERANTR